MQRVWYRRNLIDILFRDNYQLLAFTHSGHSCKQLIRECNLNLLMSLLKVYTRQRFNNIMTNKYLFNDRILCASKDLQDWGILSVFNVIISDLFVCSN